MHGLALLAALALAPANEVERPNVVVFFADDLGTLDARCYGSEDLDTPHIDRLADHGVRFTRAYAHTVCCPSRALLMTGRHPQRSGVNSWTQGDAHQPDGVHMSLGEFTLAEALRGAGYRTGLFGKWHLGASLRHGPTRQGFDEFFGLRGGFIDNRNHFFLHGKGFHDLYRGTSEVFERGRYFPHLAIEEALRFLRANQEHPFFLYVAFNLPHYPEQADPKFEARYADLPEPRRSYARVVSTTDDLVGRVLSELDALSLTEDTILLFLSDNGHSTERIRISVDDHHSGLAKGTRYGADGGGGNTGEWRGAKGTFFEGGLRVPAILSFAKKLPQGIVRDQAIHAGDFYPSILELCGVPLPDIELDGRSVLPVVADADAPSAHDLLHWQWYDRWAVSDGEWKLVAEGPDARDAFLGRLSGERPERENHAAARPKIVARLHAAHARWSARVDPGAAHRRIQEQLALHDEAAPSLQLFENCVPSAGWAFAAGETLYFLLDAAPPSGRVSFPRLHNPMRGARRVGGGELALRQDSRRWWIELPPDTEGAPLVVALDLVGAPRLPLETTALAPDAAGDFDLPAHEAAVFGKKLCYEPQPHKNTLGYWVHPEDWAQWTIEVPEETELRVVVHQGCGEGQGGSEVEVLVGGNTLRFVVEDTGHFQNFVPRTIGTVRLDAGTHHVELRPRRKAKGAVMDVRLVRLERVRS